MDAAVIEQEALRLSEPERAVLIERLLESLAAPSPSLRQAWVEECDERMRAVEAGRISLIPGAEAIREVRSTLRS
ncbi:MAG: addiction module protein [Verrucomicrobiales bacterium]